MRRVKLPRNGHRINLLGDPAPGSQKGLRHAGSPVWKGHGSHWDIKHPICTDLPTIRFITASGSPNSGPFRFLHPHHVQQPVPCGTILCNPPFLKIQEKYALSVRFLVDWIRTICSYGFTNQVRHSMKLVNAILYSILAIALLAEFVFALWFLFGWDLPPQGPKAWM